MYPNPQQLPSIVRRPRKTKLSLFWPIRKLLEKFQLPGSLPGRRAALSPHGPQGTRLPAFEEKGADELTTGLVLVPEHVPEQGPVIDEKAELGHLKEIGHKTGQGDQGAGRQTHRPRRPLRLSLGSGRVFHDGAPPVIMSRESLSVISAVSGGCYVGVTWKVFLNVFVAAGGLGRARAPTGTMRERAWGSPRV